MSRTTRKFLLTTFAVLAAVVAAGSAGRKRSTGRQGPSCVGGGVNIFMTPSIAAPRASARLVAILCATGKFTGVEAGIGASAAQLAELLGANAISTVQG